MVLTCQVVSPWPCGSECEGPSLGGDSAAQAAHVMVASVRSEDRLLFKSSKGNDFLLPETSPKEVKTLLGCCQEISSSIILM